MRIALFSDIHGNHTALEAVLADIERHHADKLVCLGDLATIGPQPIAVLDRLQALECEYVMGNHDAALLEMDKLDEYRIARSVAESVIWCEQQLRPQDFEFLRALPKAIDVPLGLGMTMYCYHGSPQSNVDLVLATTPAEELDWLFDGNRADIMAGGHTHIQMLRQHDGRWVINPGSVGNAFVSAAVTDVEPSLLPWAEYALIELDGDGIGVDLRRVRFDIPELVKQLRRSDLPIKNWWLQQYAPDG